MNRPYGKEKPFTVLQGKILKSVTGGKFDDCVIFETECGHKYQMHHRQDCCETVTLDEIAGELTDLIGAEIILAEESSGDRDGDDWTFYLLRTHKGDVTLRWCGEQSTYYSTKVEFEEFL